MYLDLLESTASEELKEEGARRFASSVSAADEPGAALVLELSAFTNDLVLWKEEDCGIEAATAVLEAKEVAFEKKRSLLYRL